jgi:hypothetical protein
MTCVTSWSYRVIMKFALVSNKKINMYNYNV